ncbi:hypothetical protein FQA39_LY15874 [Lamprigera yunnana]|nr:hypothetical protein FQA39_LY15874 [Lamprigera yunnana]
MMAQKKRGLETEVNLTATTISTEDKPITFRKEHCQSLEESIANMLDSDDDHHSADDGEIPVEKCDEIESQNRHIIDKMKPNSKPNEASNSGHLENNPTKSSKPIIVDAKEHRKRITDSILTFSLFLHKKSNFSKKDVFDIQKILNEKFVKPIIDTLKAFAESDTFRGYNGSTLYSEF